MDPEGTCYYECVLGCEVGASSCATCEELSYGCATTPGACGPGPVSFLAPDGSSPNYVEARNFAFAAAMALAAPLPEGLAVETDDQHVIVRRICDGQVVARAAKPQIVTEVMSHAKELIL